jgi:hypothetical protein
MMGYLSQLEQKLIADVEMGYMSQLGCVSYIKSVLRLS